MKRTFTSRIKVLLVLLALGAASCGEDNPDDQVTPVDQQTGCRLTEVQEKGDDEVLKVEYNAQGKVTKLTEDDYTIAFTYDANNRLIKTEETSDSDDDYTSYEYTNDLVSAIKQYDGGDLESTLMLKYNANKQLIETTEEDGNIVYKTTYEYDSKGNVTKEETFYDGVLYVRDVYVNYDDKKTPLSAVPGIVEPSALASKNNPGQKTSLYFDDRDGDGKVDSQPYNTYVTTYTYKYNSNGLPTEVTETEDNDSETTLYKYNCN